MQSLRPRRACEAAPPAAEPSQSKARRQHSVSVPGVLLLDQAKDLGRVGSVGKPLAKSRVLHQTRNSREGLEVEASRILRRDQQKKQMCRPAVERVEIDAAHVAPKDPDDAVDARKLAVRDGDAVA